MMAAEQQQRLLICLQSNNNTDTITSKLKVIKFVTQTINAAMFM